MTFQAYLDTIKAKTGKTPEDLRKLATAAGLLTPEIKAGDLVTWLKQEFGLGHALLRSVRRTHVTKAMTMRVHANSPVPGITC